MKIKAVFVFASCLVILQRPREAIAQNNEDDELLLNFYLNPPVVFRVKFYLFNLTNPSAYLAGQRPAFQEVGPFVYSQSWRKENLRYPEQDVVQYDEVKEFKFRKGLSGNIRLANQITTINFPLVAALHSSPTNKGAIAAFEAASGGEALLTKNAHQLIWGFNSPLVQLGIDSAQPGQPRRPNNKIAVFYPDINATSLGVYDVATGLGSSGYRGQILKRNGKSELGLWPRGTECNRIKGSNGFSYKSPVSNNDVLYLFAQELCRSIPLVYRSDITTEFGIPAKRFSPPSNVFSVTNPDNSCYCSGTSCPRISGVQDLSPCNFGAPILLSLPHFLNGDSRLLNDVTGLRPNPSLHETYLDVEPNTGTTMAANIKAQVNIKVSREPGSPLTSAYRDMVFPLMWFSIESEPRLSNSLQGRLGQVIGRKG